MAQGATQFSRRRTFDELGGYDESLWMGEDVDFIWTLRRLARRTDARVRLLSEPRVRPSCRRFDEWPLWRILVWTNPLVIASLRRWKGAWRGWYVHPVR